MIDIKSYRFSFDKKKRNILLRITNNKEFLSGISYLKLHGVAKDYRCCLSLNKRAINIIEENISNKEIQGEIINNYEPFTSSFVLYDNYLIIKNGNLKIINNWITRF